MIVTYEFPLVTCSLNVKMHWAKKAKIVKQQREVVAWQLRTQRHKVTLPCVVILTRFGQRRDEDNSIGSLKAVRDEVAKFIGVDDDDPRLSFIYKQAPAPKQGIRIELLF